MKKTIEVAGKNKEALLKEVQELRVKLHGATFKAAGSHAKTGAEERNIKRNIARLLTAIRGMVVDN